jgi:short-subunit dehydrogenase
VNYASTKAYLTRFSQALDTELRGTGVVVQALCPGFTHTEFHDRASMDMRAIPAWMWLSADAVVDASVRAAERGRPVVLVPGMLFRFITLLLKVTPPAVMHWGSRMLKRDV